MRVSGRIAKYIARRRCFALAAAALACAAAAVLASRAEFAENIYHLLPSEDPVVAAHIWEGRVFNKSNALFFAFANDSEKSASLAREFCAALRGARGISRVEIAGDAPESAAELALYLPLLFDADAAGRLAASVDSGALARRFARLKQSLLQGDYRAKIALKADPLGVAEAVAGGAKTRANSAFAGGGRYILAAAYGDFDCSDSAASARLIGEIDALAESFRARNPDFKVSYAGGYRISAENAAAAARDSRRTLLLTVAAMFFICVFSFRNRRLVPLALAPSLLGSLFAFALAAVAFERVSAVSVAFAAIAVGVSIDYAIHILAFADAKRGRFGECDAAEAAGRYARPVAVVAGTTAMAFAIMAIFGGGGFVQLGIFGFAGICVSAAASVYLLPAMLVGARLGNSARRTAAEVCGGFLERLGNSRAARWIALGACAAAVFGARKAAFEGDMSAFNALSAPARADYDFMKKTFAGAVSAKSILVRGKNLGEVLERAESLRAFFAGRGDAELAGAAAFLVSPKTAAENLARWRAFWSAERMEAARQAARGAGFKPEIARGFIMEAGRKSAEFKPETLLEGGLGGMFARHIYSGAEGAALSLPLEPKKGFCAESFAEELSREIPSASLIDAGYMGRRIARVSSQWLVKFAAVSLAAVAAYLYFGLGAGVAGVAAVFLPLGAGLLWSFGLLGFLGIPINIVNSVFVIFAVCLAQDYAVFVFGEIRRSGAATAVYAPVLISAATTAAAFGILSLAGHPVISGLGAVSAISVVSIFAATVVFAPAVSRRALGKRGKENF